MQEKAHRLRLFGRTFPAGRDNRSAAADSFLIKEAQRLLHNRISFVMQIPADDAAGFITREPKGG